LHATPALIGRTLRYSIVVTTANNPRALGECLRALLLQNVPGDEYEIIVIDLEPDARTFNAVDVCDTCTGGSPWVRYFGAGKKSLAEAKVLGRHQARSLAVIQITDAARPSRSWLRLWDMTGDAASPHAAVRGVERRRRPTRSRAAVLVLLIMAGSLGLMAATFAHRAGERQPPASQAQPGRAR
jgi:cellulose synthase/poly-beta-1,6-N-acetylglucosamine synthase-like glycosyltransferase